MKKIFSHRSDNAPGGIFEDGSCKCASLFSYLLFAVMASTGCHAINVAQHRAIKAAGNPQGEELFQSHCTKCHSGNPTSIFPKITNTPAMPLDNPERMRLFPRDYLIKIITEGGKSVGRSRVMPRWDEVFTADEISRIVDYLTETGATNGSVLSGN